MNFSQHQDEPHLIIEKLENELTKYKSQNKKLKKQISTLENNVNLKDQQLDEKSKCIINCISENLRLKQQIETLKRQLNIPQSNPRRKQVKSPSSIELSTPRCSFDSNIVDNVSVNNQLPYVMPPRSNSYSISSNLSEQACKISFPSPNKIPNNNSQLSPIGEDDDQYKNVFTPITIMSDLNCSFKMMIQSDNNSLIQQNEWNESIATISTTPSPKSIPLVNAKYFNPPQIFPPLQVQSGIDDEENEFDAVTVMTPSSYISSSEKGINNTSMTFKSGIWNNNCTQSTILNILNEDISDHSCHSVPRMQNMESYISIID